MTLVKDIQYYNRGIFVSDRRNTLSDAFLHSVQSSSLSNGINTIESFDGGRTQIVRTGGFTNHSLEINRLVTDVSDLYFYGISEPTSYGTSYFLKPSNFGYSLTGDDTNDINEYDLDIYFSRSTDTVLTGDALKKYRLSKALLSGVELDMQAGEFITESLSFTSKSLNVESVKTIPSNDLPISIDGVTKRILNWSHYSKNSVIPAEVSELCNNSTILNNSLIYGLTNINISMNINYVQKFDSGIHRGAVDTDDSNKWTNLQLPLDIECSFTVTAQKGHELDMDAIDKNITNQPIRIILEKTSGYFIIDLGNKNRLSSIAYSGGDTDGGLLEYTLTYQNKNNDFSCYSKSDLDFTNLSQTTERY